ncbi:MAG: hypothetical protein J6Q25_06780 [Bacteroidales bacterium]|nr:hypothetical protein [Bacteroidales bacterium]
MEMSSENSLFILYALNVEYRPSEGALLSQSASLYFSTLDKVEEVVGSYRQRYACFYDASVTDTQLYCLVVDEYEMDVLYPKKLSVRVYSPEGSMRHQMRVCEDEESYERVLPPSQFFPGDLVEAPIGDYLHTGIVLECPKSKEDNYYTLLVYPELEQEYVYAPLLFEPSLSLDDRVTNVLLQAWEHYQSQQDY